MAEQNPVLPLELRGGLILRRGTPEDANQLADFNARVHNFVPKCEITISAMTRDLMSGQHPGCRPEDFSLIVEKDTQRIVSALVLISQVWSYGGIPFKVCRPELVGTDPQYRNRGLIREQFENMHAHCSLHGQLVQAITGIPYFYRQFGYELGLPYGGGIAGTISEGYNQFLPGDSSGFQVRRAQEADLDWIRGIYLRGSARYLLTCLRDRDAWHYELVERNENNIHSVDIWVITTNNDEPAGFFICPKKFTSDIERTVTWYDLASGYNWKEVTLTLISWLVQSCQEARADEHPGSRIQLILGEEHPAYQIASEWLPEQVPPGAWYVRVSDLPAFLQLVLPVLQARLANSPWSGFSSPVIISFYSSAVKILFRDGQLSEVTLYQPEYWDEADAAFPNLSFLQLLFGFRSLSDLKYAYPDCWCRPEIQWLVETLFPRMPSNIWGLA